MGEVINLQDYKRQKDEEELDYLSALVKDLVKDIDTTPQAYYPDPQTEHMGELGMCIDSLIWASDILSHYNKVEYANKINNLIVQLKNETGVNK
jgi:hypothetical protein